MATIPEPTGATKVAAALFSILGIGVPILNQLGYTIGSKFYDLTNSSAAINNLFLQFKSWTPPRTDPLVLDLDNDGIETIGIGGTVVVFDHNADGIKTGTGWVKSDDLNPQHRR